MSKTVVYKKSSYVYFQGDVAKEVYILKSGKLILRSHDIETGVGIQETVQKGEFFGVKSAFGNYSREEDAVAVTDTQVIQFSLEEFQQIAMANTRIIIKMLRVFSAQLRRIHSKVSMLLNQQDSISSEEGMRLSALFYASHKKVSHSKYIWGRYLELYPTGQYSDVARQALRRFQQSDVSAASPYGEAQSTDVDIPDLFTHELEDTEPLFAQAKMLVGNQKYEEARQIYQDIIQKENGQHVICAEISIGRILFQEAKYEKVIQHCSAIVKNNPNMAEIGEALYCVGVGYFKIGEMAKAKAFLGKAEEALEKNSSLQGKAHAVLQGLEG